MATAPDEPNSEPRQVTTLPVRRFPPPRTVEEHNGAYFIVRDNTGQPLGYVYFDEELGRARPWLDKLNSAGYRRLK